MALLLGTSAALPGCAADEGRVTPIYDPATRDLVRLDYDIDRDGRVDVRTFLANGRPVRLEGDQDRDGKVDRWEYYGADGQLLKLGTSSGRDGVEDTWLYQTGSTRRIEMSTGRDGVIDRIEHYDGTRLARVETDVNRDGTVDHWEEYEGGDLRVLSMDDDQHPGRPVRRLTYRDGAEPLLEVDLDGDGEFQAAVR
ncbi:MAG: hypothetical protein AB7K63_19605 [Vicinamibacterales bacterium]